MPHKTASFRFFDALNDFLPPDKRKVDFILNFQGEQSVKHLFESCGVPHTEVGLLTANANTINQSYIVQDGDVIEVHPYGQPLLLPFPPRFVLDNHLGKLAAYLRLLGFDAAYRNTIQDAELALISSQQGRVLLTRDRCLLMRSIISQGYCIRSLIPRQQVREVLSRYHIFPAITPFGRCVHCNNLLEQVLKYQILDRLEPLTRLYFNEFQHCPTCGQVYWKGSHYEHIREFIDELRLSHQSDSHKL